MEGDLLTEPAPLLLSSPRLMLGETEDLGSGFSQKSFVNLIFRGTAILSELLLRISFLLFHQLGIIFGSSTHNRVVVNSVSLHLCHLLAYTGLMLQLVCDLRKTI